VKGERRVTVVGCKEKTCIGAYQTRENAGKRPGWGFDQVSGKKTSKDGFETTPGKGFKARQTREGNSIRSRAVDSWAPGHWSNLRPGGEKGDRTLYHVSLTGVGVKGVGVCGGFEKKNHRIATEGGEATGRENK